MIESTVEKYESNFIIAKAFMIAKQRLPKELADETKMLARIGGVPGHMLAKFETVIDYISGPHFGN